MELSTIAYQLALTAVESAGIMALFIMIHKKNKVTSDHERPPWVFSGLLGWVFLLFRVKEPDIIDKVCLDAAAFLRFIRMMRTIFFLVAFFSCAILIPINLSYNPRHIPSLERDSLSILTIRDVRGSYLWAHIMMTYIITATVIVIVQHHWSVMVDLRAQYFLSPEYVHSFDSTLTVIHIPERSRSEEGIRALLDSVKVPYAITEVHIGRRLEDLPRLVKVHNDTVHEFEQKMVQYLKGGKFGKKRPTVRVRGFLGMGGEVRDAIDHYTKELRQTERVVMEHRAKVNTHLPENYGFVSFATVSHAHTVARLLEKKRPRGAKFMLTPNPKDIIWENLNKSPAALMGKWMMGWLLVITSITTNVFGISFLVNISAMTYLVPFLNDWAQMSPASYHIFYGVLLFIVFKAFDILFDLTIRRLFRYQGAVAQSYLQSSLLARYLAFSVILDLILFTIIGVSFESGTTQLMHLKPLLELPSKINKIYIDQGSYWLIYFLCSFSIDLSDLVELLPLVWNWTKKYIFRLVPIPREVMHPRTIEFWSHYAHILLLGAIGLVFAPLVPLTTVGALLLMWLNSWVYKHRFMFRDVSVIEKGGYLWNVAINSLLVSLLLMQATMLLTIGLQSGWKSFALFACIPPFILVLLFKVYIKCTFARSFKYYIPTESELRDSEKLLQSDESRNRLSDRFTHPALHEPLRTPLLYPYMMPLLRKVYAGRLD